MDWALGRDRCQGTPLPIWRSDAPGSDYVECIGVAELRPVGHTLRPGLTVCRPMDLACARRGTMRRV